MTLSFDGDGQTPLSADDTEGLIPPWVATLGDLNEVERTNIGRARVRWLGRGRRPVSILDDQSLRRLHRDMFADVWRWAGRYRTRETSIGTDPLLIAVGVRELVGDAPYWLDQDTRSGVARFHHRLVRIHPFVNGNGRHGRLAADVLAVQAGVDVPRWMGERAEYLSALRHADATDDVGPLTDFMWPNAPSAV